MLLKITTFRGKTHCQEPSINNIKRNFRSSFPFLPSFLLSSFSLPFFLFFLSLPPFLSSSFDLQLWSFLFDITWRLFSWFQNLVRYHIRLYWKTLNYDLNNNPPSFHTLSHFQCLLQSKWWQWLVSWQRHLHTESQLSLQSLRRSFWCCGDAKLWGMPTIPA